MCAFVCLYVSFILFLVRSFVRSFVHSFCGALIGSYVEASASKCFPPFTAARRAQPSPPPLPVGPQCSLATADAAYCAILPFLSVFSAACFFYDDSQSNPLNTMCFPPCCRFCVPCFLSLATSSFSFSFALFSGCYCCCYFCGCVSVAPAAAALAIKLCTQTLF